MRGLLQNTAVRILRDPKVLFAAALFSRRYYRALDKGLYKTAELESAKQQS